MRINALFSFNTQPKNRALLPAFVVLFSLFFSPYQGIVKSADLNQDPQGQFVYTVKYNDTLGEISMKYLGTFRHYAKLAEYNNIPNPNKIYPEQKIVLSPATSFLLANAHKFINSGEISQKYDVNDIKEIELSPASSQTVIRIKDSPNDAIYAQYKPQIDEIKASEHRPPVAPPKTEKQDKSSYESPYNDLQVLFAEMNSRLEKIRNRRLSREENPELHQDNKLKTPISVIKNKLENRGSTKAMTNPDNREKAKLEKKRNILSFSMSSGYYMPKYNGKRLGDDLYAGELNYALNSHQSLSLGLGTWKDQNLEIMPLSIAAIYHVTSNMSNSFYYGLRFSRTDAQLKTGGKKYKEYDDNHSLFFGGQQIIAENLLIFGEANVINGNITFNVNNAKNKLRLSDSNLRVGLKFLL